MTYVEGDEVEIFDGDLAAWLPGKVEGWQEDTPMGRVLVIDAPGEFYPGREGKALPVKYGVPDNMLSLWVRRRT